MTTYVISGSDTNIGKTYVTAALATSLNAAHGFSAAHSTGVVKAIQTGINLPAETDAETIHRLSGVTVSTLITLDEPLSPSMAAVMAKVKQISLNGLVKKLQPLMESSENLLIEGSGGLLAPINDRNDNFVDLALALGAQIVLVVSPDLGTINHTALSLAYLRDRGISHTDVVINGWPQKPGVLEMSNALGIVAMQGACLSGVFPRVDATSHGDFTDVAVRSMCDKFGGTWNRKSFVLTQQTKLNEHISRVKSAGSSETSAQT